MATNKAHARAARAYMAEHPGVKYTQALRAVDTSTPETFFYGDLPDGPLLITGADAIARRCMAQEMYAKARTLHLSVNPDDPTRLVMTFDPMGAAPLTPEYAAKEITSRQQWMHEAGVTDWREGFWREGTQWSELAIVFDGLPSLLERDPTLEETLEELLRAGSSTGVHVIATAEYPEALAESLRQWFSKRVELMRPEVGVAPRGTVWGDLTVSGGEPMDIYAPSALGPADTTPAPRLVVIPRINVDLASGPLLITGPGKTTLARLILAQSNPRTAVYLHQSSTGSWAGLNPHTGQTVTAGDLQDLLEAQSEVSPAPEGTTAPTSSPRGVVVVDDLDALMAHGSSEYVAHVLWLLRKGRGMGIAVVATAADPDSIPDVGRYQFVRQVTLFGATQGPPAPRLAATHSSSGIHAEGTEAFVIPHLDARALDALGSGSDAFPAFALAPIPATEPEPVVALITGPLGSGKTMQLLTGLDDLAPAVLIHGHGQGWAAREVPGGQIIPTKKLGAHIAASKGLTVAVDDLPGLLSPTDPAMSDPVIAEAVLSVIEQARAGRLSLVITAVDPADLPESLRGAIADRLDLSMHPTGAGRARIAAMSQLGRPTEEYPIPERTREEVQGLCETYGYTGMF